MLNLRREPTKPTPGQFWIGAEQIRHHTECVQNSADFVDHGHVDIKRSFPRQQIGGDAKIDARLLLANPFDHRGAMLLEVGGER